MSRKVLTILGIVVIALGIVTFSALFTVHQTEQALVLQFGKIQQVIKEPGLKWKLPIIQNVIFYDRRVLDLDPPAEEVIAADQKRLVVEVRDAA